MHIRDTKMMAIIKLLNALPLGKMFTIPASHIILSSEKRVKISVLIICNQNKRKMIKIHMFLIVFMTVLFLFIALLFFVYDELL
ncbi:hypothetical protein DDT56_04415 [Brenneria corticis]|uniref:Uncharacterized protein n=1 Tax=Brenneria corticis TaxID=2173106 RepID=A0A2U1U8Z9_9GAMM|nr:hypothetical protein DDT56_04415 [Brenneria sp. CFCC 11842]